MKRNPYHPSIAAISSLLTLFSMVWGCDPFHTGFDDLEDAILYEAAVKTDAPEDADTLLMMTWNIKFGGGRIDFFHDCYGDRVLMTEEEVYENLEGLAGKINQVSPDILILQEVDILSKRSAYVDQVQWLLDNTELNYGAYASQWKADYIPSDGIGRVDSGNAVLSRWPFEEAVRISLPLIEEQDPLTRYFYLKRNILKTSIDLPFMEELYVLDTHFSAYAKDDTKKEQLEKLLQVMDEISSSGAAVVMGGDLNMIPPGSERVRDFPDSVCEEEQFQADDYSEETHWLDPLYASYESAIPLEVYETDNEPYLTHTTDGNGFWNRKLDYIFTNHDFVPYSFLTHQDKDSGGMETMPLSDHCPVTVELEVSK